MRCACACSSCCRGCPSLADRVRALRAAEAVSPAVETLLARASAWVAAGDAADPSMLPQLRHDIEAADPPLGAASTWTDLVTASLIQRLRDLTDLVV